MRKILNFIILFLILTLGNQIAPEAIVTDGWKTTLLVTVICYIAEEIISILIAITFIGGIFVSVWKDNTPLFVIAIIVLLISIGGIPILALIICEHFIPAFAVNGTVTYIILMLCINILSVSENTKNEKEKNEKEKNE